MGRTADGPAPHGGAADAPVGGEALPRPHDHGTGEVLRDVDDVRAWLARHVYAPSPDDPPVGRVGLEVELLPFWLARDRRPAARLALVEIVALVESIDGAERAADSKDRRPAWRLGGAVVTEEPGAQLEIAGPPEPDAGTAIAGVERLVDVIARTFDDAGAGLAAASLDLWSETDDLPVQVEAPRYEAMAEYFRRRGDTYGPALMRASCSLQVNLDLGPPEVAPRRWLLANLAAPVWVAAFAASPTPEGVNGRAMRWRRADPTRTGVSPPLIAGEDDPLEHVTADVLRADVLLVEREDRTYAGRPGWTFADWVAEPHPRVGAATTRDLALHLTTLFPEVRLRRYIEVRGLDVLPRRWRATGVAGVVGLLYDARATEAALALLEPHRAELPDLLVRAARDGLRDPLLSRLVVDVLEHARDGAERLGIPHVTEVDDYLERYPRRGLHPADELREALATGPAAAFAWAEARG